MDLPTAWEGSITRNPARTHSLPPQAHSRGDDGTDGPGTDDPPGRANSGRGVQRDVDGSVVMPVAHLANFALPAALDVFGSQAVTEMQAGDGFVALVEYGPAEVDTALFERRGVPRRLVPADFSPRTLNRALPDQVGAQVFATESGRAFSLYVVLAGRARIGRTLRDVNAVLSTLGISRR